MAETYKESTFYFCQLWAVKEHVLSSILHVQQTDGRESPISDVAVMTFLD